MSKIYFVFVFLLIAALQQAFGQGTLKGTLSVPKYAETDITELLKMLPHTRADTSKIWLLYKIAAVYWWRRSDSSKDLDSCIYFAQQALYLSNRLHFSEGKEEAVFIMCKTYPELGKKDLAERLITSSAPEQQSRLWLVLGDFYMSLPGSQRKNLDRTFKYYSNALKSGESISNVHWLLETQIALGKYYFLLRDLNKGKQFFFKVIDYWRARGNLSEEAHWWSELGRYMPTSSDNREEGLGYLEQSLKLYTRLKDKPNMAYTMEDLSTLYKAHFDLDRAAEHLNGAIALLKEAKINKLYRYYYGLAEIYQKKGNFKLALSNLLAALDNMEMLKDERMKGVVYSNLGEIYYILGEDSNSIKYFLLSMPLLTRTGLHLLYYNAKNVTDGYIRMGKANTALQFIQNFEREHVPESAYDKVTIYGATANCYQAIGQYKLAEEYYLKMIHFNDQVYLEGSIFAKKSLFGAEADYLIARFYVNQKKYAKAAPFMKRLPASNRDAVFLKNAELLRFKIDSADGNFISAINHYETYTKFKDSLYNVASTGKLADMEVKYETRQKEKDIKLLQKESQLQQRRIAQTAQLRNFSYAGIAMLAIIIAIGYNRYRLKQNSFRQLELKQTEINEKNVALQELNLMQEKLIEEKQWLVKEIHHRVKNNLQLMDSLLKSQQHYIDDEVAFQAIQTGQRRIQAMSMVHQKLYMTDQLSQIEMQPYIHELVNSLKTSFSETEKIILKIDVENVKLDVIQAIPVGLIINEGITNAFKYAFQKGKPGEICLSLKVRGDVMELIISDNGIGLADELSSEKNSTFGMTLIKGLCLQMQGELNIKNEPGLHMRIIFAPYYSMT